MKGISNLTKNRVKEFISILSRKRCTKENLEMVRKMAKESIIFKMETFTKENSEMMKNLEWENRLFKMEMFLKESG